MDQVGLAAEGQGITYERELWSGYMYLSPGQSVSGPVTLGVPSDVPPGMYTIDVVTFYNGQVAGFAAVDVEVLP